MGTEVLHPQDYFIQRIRVAPAVFHRRKSYYGYGNGNGSSSKPNNNNNNHWKPRRSPEPAIVKKSASTDDFRSKSLGQVTILRRGETIDLKPSSKAQDRSQNGDVLVVPKQIRLSSPANSAFGDKYAGSACSLSPSPRALPLPSFFNKKQSQNDVDFVDSATKDLRRLLRLD